MGEVHKNGFPPDKPIRVVTIRITGADLVVSFKGPNSSIFPGNDPITITCIGAEFRHTQRVKCLAMRTVLIIEKVAGGNLYYFSSF